MMRTYSHLERGELSFWKIERRKWVDERERISLTKIVWERERDLGRKRRERESEGKILQVWNLLNEKISGECCSKRWMPCTWCLSSVLLLFYSIPFCSRLLLMLAGIWTIFQIPRTRIWVSERKKMVKYYLLLRHGFLSSLFLLFSLSFSFSFLSLFEWKFILSPTISLSLSQITFSSLPSIFSYFFPTTGITTRLYQVGTIQHSSNYSIWSQGFLIQCVTQLHTKNVPQVVFHETNFGTKLINGMEYSS